MRAWWSIDVGQQIGLPIPRKRGFSGRAHENRGAGTSIAIEPQLRYQNHRRLTEVAVAKKKNNSSRKSE
jgi:hypothetical protein